MDTNKMTTEELFEEYNSIVDEFYKSDTIHSLSDFEEIVLELNKREKI